MTDLRQAAQQALEALEEFCEAGTMLRPIERREALRKALKQKAEPAQETEAFGFVTVRRLSQRFENHHDQYQFYPAGQIPYLDNVDECHTVYTTPPQQQAEPVAVVDEVIHAAWAAGFVEGEKAALEQQAEPVGWLDGNDKLADFMHRDLKAEHDKRGSATPKDFTIPVYTAPPQRKELSAGEILNMMPSTIPAEYDGELMEFARAVEAKIKEGT